MCGRAVQTQGAVFAASTSLKSNSRNPGEVVDSIGPRLPPCHGHYESSSASKATSDAAPTESQLAPEEDGSYPWHDNFNLSPGHDAVVFTINKQGELQMDRKIWGLVTKGGTTKSPVPTGASKHFANLMFNARSDTLFSKPTFAKLLNEGKTCLIPFDGFFEWKADALGGGKGKKQPYFVFRNKTDKTERDATKRPYLLMAGLWTSVSTGYSPPLPAKMDTFTILTTEVCDSLKWLHSRMPVCIWDEDLAMQWLQQASQKLHQKMDLGAHKTQEAMLQWHAVSTQMSSVKFRGAECIKPLPKPKSVKSFFVPVSKQNKGDSKCKKETAAKQDATTRVKSTSAATTKSSSFAAMSGTKRPASTAKESPSSKSIKPKTNPPVAKKGSITSFFSPKKPKN